MYRKLAILAVGLLVGAAACSDLDVTNPNNPGRDRVLTTPGDIENLIGSSWLTWYLSSRNDVGMPLSTMAFETSNTPANFGMEVLARIPRIAINNQVSDSYAGVYGRMWYASYKAVAAVNDGLGRINSGLDLGSPEANLRAQAFGKFVQGISHGTVALLYDQGFVYRETDDPATTPLQLKPAADVMVDALAMLDEAIELSEGASFTIPKVWLKAELDVPASELAKMAHSYKARFRAQVARSLAERQNVDWTAVIADLDAGITSDFTPVFDDVTLWDITASYNTFSNWSQISNFTRGMADVSGNYQQWVQTPVADRQPFLIVTPDERFPQGATEDEQKANPGLYIKWNTGGQTRPDRGTWRWSNYRDSRFDWFTGAEAGWTGPLPELTVADMRLLRAEALYHKGDFAGAAELINVTRVGNGGLPPATAAGIPVAADCVPKLPSGACGDLWEALKWEKRLEIHKQGFGSAFFDARGWDNLYEGTPIQFPIPAKELNVIQVPIYTFGGVGQPGGAPKPSYDW